MEQLKRCRRWLALLAVGVAISCGCSGLPGQPARSGSASPSFVHVSSKRGALPTAALAPVTISAGFNGTAIPAGRVIWFSGVLSYSGTGSLPVTFHVDGGTVQFVANGTSYSLPAPSATVVLSPTATAATTVYDPASASWLTTAPLSGCGAVFVGAVAWKAPVNLPGGIKPVAWQAQFSTDTPGATFKWKWAAAVYSSFTDDLTQVGVKPVDSNQGTAYNNSDHAGTPENFKPFVTGGATGGGGSNYTGGLTGDLVVVPAPSDNGPLNGSAKISHDQGGTVTVGRFTLQIPPHALTQDATVGISVPDQGVLQCNLSITPESANGFLLPVVLSSDYSGGNVTDPNTLVEVWYDASAGVWRAVTGSTVDTAQNRVLAPLRHFSSYGVDGGRAGW